MGVLFPVPVFTDPGLKVGGIILAGDTRVGWEEACLAGGRGKARDSDLFPLPVFWGERGEGCGLVCLGDRSPERDRGSLPGRGWE